jgi:hypothetical protein
MLLPSCEKSLNQTLRSRLASKLRLESKVAPITLTEMTTRQRIDLRRQEVLIGPN